MLIVDESDDNLSFLLFPSIFFLFFFSLSLLNSHFYLSSSICTNLNSSAVAGITLGMSGVDRPADKELVSQWIHEVLPATVPLAIHNDATAALSSGKCTSSDAWC